MLQELRRDGIIKPSLTFDAFETTAHFLDQPAYNAHVQAKATQPPEPLALALGARQWPMLCHTMQAAVTAPGLLEIALKLLPLANEYFEEPALLYSMNAFWTQPAPGAPPYQDTHSWHRDGDDRKQLVAFFMLTPVIELEDGAHQYQHGTHVLNDNQLGRHFTAPPPEAVTTIFGVAGEVFLEDTRGLHQAHRPRFLNRGLAWARFGVSDPPESYGWDKLSPVPAALLGVRYPEDPEIRKAIHLIVA